MQLRQDYVIAVEKKKKNKKKKKRKKKKNREQIARKIAQEVQRSRTEFSGMQGEAAAMHQQIWAEF